MLWDVSMCINYLLFFVLKKTPKNLNLSSPPSRRLLLQLKSLSFDEISPFQETFNEFQFTLSDSVNLSLAPSFFLMFPLIISVSCTHLISQYLLIYLVLCNLLMLGLCLTQPACLMRYMYKSIFLLALFHSAVRRWG